MIMPKKEKFLVGERVNKNENNKASATRKTTPSKFHLHLLVKLFEAKILFLAIKTVLRASGCIDVQDDR